MGLRCFMILALSWLVTSPAFSATSATTRPQTELLLPGIVAESGDRTDLVIEVRTVPHGHYITRCNGEKGLWRRNFTCYNQGPVVYGSKATVNEVQVRAGGFPVTHRCTVVGGEFPTDKSLNIFMGGQWDGKKEGAIHKILGRINLFGYEFISGETAPLTFMMTKKGYRFLHGSGTIKDPKSGKSYVLNKPLKKSQLIKAAQQGDLVEVKRLLDEGIAIDATVAPGLTALLIACREGHVSVVKELVRRGARINQADRDGLNPLLMATMNDRPEVIGALLAQGAQVDARDRKERTALMLAAQKGNAKAVKALLEGGADIDEKVGRDNVTPLMIAARNGRLEVVKILVEMGADLNIRDKDKWTALEYATTYDRHDVARFLRERGAKE